MSTDGRINAALFNFCIAADDGPRQPLSEEDQKLRPRASLDDLRWLKQAMEGIELPDKATKRCLTAITEWFIPVKERLPRYFSAANNPAQAAAVTSGTPMLMLPAPSQGSNENKQQQQQDAVAADSSDDKKKQEQQQEAPRPLLLTDLPATIPDTVLDAAEELCDLIEDLNYAREFQLMKGIRVFIDILAVGFDAANNSNGVSVLPRASAAQDKKQKNDDNGDDDATVDLQATAKQWSAFRCTLLRALGAASANFEVFQNELCTKHNWAALLVPQLTYSMRSNLVSVSTQATHQPLQFIFPDETAALLLCVSNIMRQHAPALQLFLQNDGMFHLSNVVEFLRTATARFSCGGSGNGAAATASLSGKEKKALSGWINALRRAFSAARYLVDEHGVTSQRVLRAAIDVLHRTSLELAAPSSTAAAAGAAAAAAAAAKSEEQEEEDDFVSRNVENAATAAAFAAKTVTFALQRVLEQAAKNKAAGKGGSDNGDIEKLMPVYGAHLTEKLSGTWWQTMAKSSGNGSNKDEVAGAAEQPRVVDHPELNESIGALVAVIGSLRQALPAFASSFSS